MDYVACMVCGTVFNYANAAIKEAVKEANGNKLTILHHTWNLLVCCLSLAQFFKADLLCINYGIHCRQYPTFLDFFRAVAVNDFLVKFVTMLTKVAILFAPQSWLGQRERGNALRLAERTSQLYRYSIPLPISFLQCLYLSNWKSKLIGVIWRILFFDQIGRLKKLDKCVKRWMLAGRCLVRGIRCDGNVPDEADLLRAGEVCPICFDNFKTPLVFECSHVFCENCIDLWLQKKSFCPMCRRKLPGLTWTEGGTLADVIYR